jgi:hypothetical protein
MSQKYLPEASASIITNDLYLAAFLHSAGCGLDHVERNERRRVSFVFVGERVRELREAYRTGPVHLDMRCFRESLILIRRLMDGGNEQRSAQCPTLQAPSGVISRMQLSPA